MVSVNHLKLHWNSPHRSKQEGALLYFKMVSSLAAEAGKQGFYSERLSSCFLLKQETALRDKLIRSLQTNFTLRFILRGAVCKLLHRGELFVLTNWLGI